MSGLSPRIEIPELIRLGSAQVEGRPFHGQTKVNGFGHLCEASYRDRQEKDKNEQKAFQHGALILLWFNGPDAQTGMTVGVNGGEKSQRQVKTHLGGIGRKTIGKVPGPIIAHYSLQFGFIPKEDASEGTENDAPIVGMRHSSPITTEAASSSG